MERYEEVINQLFAWTLMDPARMTTFDFTVKEEIKPFLEQHADADLDSMGLNTHDYNQKLEEILEHAARYIAKSDWEAKYNAKLAEKNRGMSKYAGRVDDLLQAYMEETYMPSYEEALSYTINRVLLSAEFIHSHLGKTPEMMEKKARVLRYVLNYIAQAGWETKYIAKYAEWKQAEDNKMIHHVAKERIAETPEFTRKVQSEMNRLRYPTN